MYFQRCCHLSRSLRSLYSSTRSYRIPIPFVRRQEYFGKAILEQQRKDWNGNRTFLHSVKYSDLSVQTSFKMPKRYFSNTIDLRFSKLEGLKIFDLDDKAVALTDLWKNRKILLAFIRHFG